MLDITTTYTVTISVLGIDVLALKKLSMVSAALGQKLGGPAQQEQEALVGILDATSRKIELSAGGFRG